MNAIIIDSNSLNDDLDFRLDFELFYDLLLTLTDSSLDNSQIFFFDHDDAAKHTFHYSIEQKNYKLKVKASDFKFKQPEYIPCHCCETLVLDPATNKNLFNLDLGTEITNFVHMNIDNYDKFSFVTSNGNFVTLANHLENIQKLGKIVLPNSKITGEFILKNIEANKIIKLEDCYSELGQGVIKRKIVEKEKPTVLSKFGKKK